MKLHNNLSQGRWYSFTLAEQLGNIGSEYERAVRWKEKNQNLHFQNAFARMLELLDLTISDPRWQNHRLKELVRIREWVCSEFYLPNFAKQHPNLKKYFLQFAILAKKAD